MYYKDPSKDRTRMFFVFGKQMLKCIWEENLPKLLVCLRLHPRLLPENVNNLHSIAGLYCDVLAGFAWVWVVVFPVVSGQRLCFQVSGCNS